MSLDSQTNHKLRKQFLCRGQNCIKVLRKTRENRARRSEGKQDKENEAPKTREATKGEKMKTFTLLILFAVLSACMSTGGKMDK